MSALRKLLMLSLAFLYLMGQPAVQVCSAEELGQTAQIFEKYKRGIAQVRVVDIALGEKYTIGSGFFVSADGLLITNFHVISALVHSPEKYRIEIAVEAGKVNSGTLLYFDVVHDLAVVKSDAIPEVVFGIRQGELAKGTRLFSLGNPHDLGLTIVEGTFNGLIENSLYEKIHFTGAVNAGMSGGPTILESGEIVGVNVSTAGNEVSFLVPGKYVTELLDRQRTVGIPPTEQKSTALQLVRDQLLANQKGYINHLLAQPFKISTLEGYRITGQISPAFRCWSDGDYSKDNRYTSITQLCSTEDDIFISDKMNSGSIEFRHVSIAGTSLNQFQFYSLFQTVFNRSIRGFGGEEEDFTNFSCRSQFVTVNTIPMRVVFCSRAYKKLDGVFDSLLVGATLSNPLSGMQASLRLTGVSFENAVKFSRVFLESIAWDR